MGFIKNVLNGLLNFLKSLLSFGKKEKPNTSNTADAIIAEVKQATNGLGQSTPDSNGDQAAAGQPAKAEPAKAESASQKSKKAKKGKKPAAVFLEAEEARGYTSGSQPQAAQSASTLNLPKPKVSASNSKPQAAKESGTVFSQFGSRRRPGANMQAFLDMAKTIK